MADADLFLEEYLCALLKLIGIFGSEVLTGGTVRKFLSQGRVAVKIVGQTLGHIFALWNEAHAGFDILLYLGQQDWVVGATQNDGVDGRILGHEFVNALLDEIIGTGAVGFVVLYKGHPERAGHAADTDVGKKFGYLDVVTMTAHGAFGSQQAHVTAMGERADNFGRGADDA